MPSGHPSSSLYLLIYPVRTLRLLQNLCLTLRLPQNLYRTLTKCARAKKSAGHEVCAREKTVVARKFVPDSAKVLQLPHNLCPSLRKMRLPRKTN